MAGKSPTREAGGAERPLPPPEERCSSAGPGGGKAHGRGKGDFPGPETTSPEQGRGADQEMGLRRSENQAARSRWSRWRVWTVGRRMEPGLPREGGCGQARPKFWSSEGRPGSPSAHLGPRTGVTWSCAPLLRLRSSSLWAVSWGHHSHTWTSPGLAVWQQQLNFIYFSLDGQCWTTAVTGFSCKSFPLKGEGQ